MTWTLTQDVAHYCASAGEFLASRAVQHTIQLTVIETLRIRGSSAFGGAPPLFGWWRSAGAAAGPVQSVFQHTPPYGALLTALPPGSAQPLAEQLAERGRKLAGVTAVQDDAAAFAAAWGRLTGASAHPFRRSRLFSLGELKPPDPRPRGAARVADAADRDLLESWLAAFASEMADLPGNLPGVVDDRLSYGGLTLWELDGTAVSLAGALRPAAGVVRLGPVYTPPDQRQRGYAGAVTTAVSRAVLEAGAQHVVLFTDLANPTSNALYQRLGFRAVEDRVLLLFGD